MMSERDKEIAKELKRRLAESVQLINFIVFGSRARDEQDEYSDMDIFLVVSSLNKELKEKIFDIVWEVSFENLIVISTLIFTKDEVENSPLKASPLLRNIFEEGIPV